MIEHQVSEASIQRGGGLIRDQQKRIGQERFEAEVKDLTMPVDFSLETMQEFIDWQRATPYEVVRGEGECAI